jgi:hypothetical protein
MKDAYGYSKCIPKFLTVRDILIPNSNNSHEMVMTCVTSHKMMMMMMMMNKTQYYETYEYTYIVMT